MRSNARTTVTLRLTNSLSEPRTVILEPWTTELVVPAGKSVQIRAKGDAARPLEVEMYGDRVIVYCFDSEGAEMYFVE
jgi:hypothetical protein